MNTRAIMVTIICFVNNDYNNEQQSQEEEPPAAAQGQHAQEERIIQFSGIPRSD
jgi:hypothetical protein